VCAKHTALHNSTHTQRETEPRGTVVYTHTHRERQRHRGAEDKGHREVSQEVQSVENNDECGKHRLLAYREKAT
jgi:hypothetical protein